MFLNLCDAERYAADGAECVVTGARWMLLSQNGRENDGCSKSINVRCIIYLFMHEPYHCTTVDSRHSIVCVFVDAVDELLGGLSVCRASACDRTHLFINKGMFDNPTRKLWIDARLRPNVDCLLFIWAVCLLVKRC